MNFIKVPDAKNKPMLINLEEVAYIKTDNNGDAWIRMRNGEAVVTLDTPEEIYEILCGAMEEYMTALQAKAAIENIF